MLKINLFTYVYWPEQFLVNELTDAWAKQSHQVTVLTGLPNYPKGDFFDGYDNQSGPFHQSYNGVQIQRYPMIPRKKGFVRLALNYISHLVMALVYQFRLPKADWAFVFGTSPITTAVPAIIWAKLNGAKVCIWLQDLWPESVAAVGATGSKSILYQALGKLVHWIYSQTDLMLIQSPGFKDNLNEFSYKGPFHVIPNWAPSVDYSKSEKPNWFQSQAGALNITFAGNIGLAQSLDTVVEAALLLKENKSIQFHIVGDGSELIRIKAKTYDVKLSNLIFYGRKPVDDMPGLFKHSQALLVTLKKDPIFAKTIPSKVQAYMASGKPLIGSLDGIGHHIIKDSGCGFSVPSEDSKALAEAILKLSQMTEQELKEMGHKAHNYFLQNYQKEHVVSQILEILEKYK